MVDGLELLAQAAHHFVREERACLLIGGQLVDAADHQTIAVEDPATGQTISSIPAAGERDVEAAVQAAKRAGQSSAWRNMSASHRSHVLYRIADLIEEHRDVFAELDAIDGGKTLAGTRSYDIANAIEWFRYYAGWPTKLEGATIPGPSVERMIYTRREPVGVVAQIVPWNFPFMMCAWKLAPALAAGCTCILKPAEQTSLSALYFGEILTQADILPPGVVNILSGFGQVTGKALVTHPDVAAVSFTGSRTTAEQVVHDSASSFKRLSLELGGKSPNVVLPDTDPRLVSTQLASAALLNQGENCCAGTRLFVHQDQFDDVVEAVGEAAGQFQLGHGLLPETTMGPLVSRSQFDRVVGYIEDGIAEGGRVVCGGRPDQSLKEKGYFVEPTIFTELQDDARPVRDEIFGPVLVASPYASLEEVAARANATEFGLAAGIWTNEVASAHKLAALLEAGTVWINTYNETNPAVPFGGYKASGWGREHGSEVFEHYLETKAVWVNLEGAGASMVRGKGA